MFMTGYPTVRRTSEGCLTLRLLFSLLGKAGFPPRGTAYQLNCVREERSPAAVVWGRFGVFRDWRSFSAPSAHLPQAVLLWGQTTHGNRKRGLTARRPRGERTQLSKCRPWTNHGFCLQPLLRVPTQVSIPQAPEDRAVALPVSCVGPAPEGLRSPSPAVHTHRPLPSSSAADTPSETRVAAQALLPQPPCRSPSPSVLHAARARPVAPACVSQRDAR